MEESVLLAKEAYVLSQQIQELEGSLRDAESASGYHAYARNFNRMLERALDILKRDEVMLRTIEGLVSYDETVEFGYAREFSQLKADLPILRSALCSFFQFYMPPQEKAKIGFGS